MHFYPSPSERRRNLFSAPFRGSKRRFDFGKQLMPTSRVISCTPGNLLRLATPRSDAPAYL